MYSVVLKEFSNLASTTPGNLHTFGIFSSETALQRYYCSNLTPKYLRFQNNLDIACLDRTVIVKDKICIIPEHDMEGIIDVSCRSVVGLCFSSCSQIVSSTVAPSIEPLPSTNSLSFEQMGSRISEHVKTLSVEAFNAIIGVAVSSFLLLVTTFIAWATKKFLSKRSSHAPLSENLPLTNAFENPTAVTVHQPAAEISPTPANQTIQSQNNNASFNGPVILENVLYDSPKAE